MWRTVTTWRASVVGVCVLAAAMPLVARQILEVVSGFSLCPFRFIFGHDCVFCGLTRATLAAATGNLHTATRLHPAWPVALGLVWLVAGLGMLDLGDGGRRAESLVRFVLDRWIWFLGGIVLLRLAR